MCTPYEDRVCRNETQTSCNIVNEEKCERQYETKYNKVCETAEDTQCSTVVNTQCNTVTEKKCGTRYATSRNKNIYEQTILRLLSFLCFCMP